MNTAPGQRHLHILLVEDEPDFAQMTMTILKHYGYEAHHALTARKAITHLQENKPDLILLDLNLPGQSGWQVLEETRRLYGQCGVPVIVTTAYSDEMNRLVGWLHKVDHYLVKPFTPVELKRVIERVLGVNHVGLVS